MDVSLHSFTSGRFTLWADRVPVVHGRANLFTLWERLPDGTNKRHDGGMSIRQLRTLLGRLSCPSS
jgi:hypothetical protein